MRSLTLALPVTLTLKPIREALHAVGFMTASTLHFYRADRALD